MQNKVKILVIRFSSIGDIVLTTPIIRCLKNQLEGAIEIHFLTKKAYESIVLSNPNVAKVWSIEKHTNEVLADLKNEGFDYIIDLHKNLRSKQVVRGLKSLSFTFDKLNVKKWMLTNFKINRMPDVHIVDRYFEAVKPLGVENDCEGLDYFISESEKVDIHQLPTPFNTGYIAFAIGGQHQGKKLPTLKLIALCKEINHPIVLLGGKEDQPEGDAIVQAAGNHVYNACGKYSIHQSASLIEQAEIMITHDTGLMHIAAAYKQKIISLWGCTSPIFGMSPYLPDPSSVILEADHLEKRPCSKLGNKCSYGDFRCANEIDNDRIIEAVERLFKK